MVRSIGYENVLSEMSLWQKKSIIPQTALDAGTHLAEELALVQSRVSYTEWTASDHFCGFTDFDVVEVGRATDFAVEVVDKK
jgi:hypothetical protein